MLKNFKERWTKSDDSPIAEILHQLDALGRYGSDDFLERVRTYANYAQACGLRSQAVVDSCIDLAETYTSVPALVYKRQVKLQAWQERRAAAVQTARQPIEIDMELDPIYYEAILGGSKTYEGRAYKPDSDKNYHDIRPGDQVRFRLSNRKPGFMDEAVQRGLQPGTDMLCTVKNIFFAPTVHGMYQIPRFNGLGFQPMIDGNSELIQLQRAAVYHTFPGYHDLINDHGFLGIQVENPCLVQQAG